MRMMTVGKKIALVVLCIAMLAFFFSAAPRLSPDDPRPLVAASLFPVFDLARQVAGDVVEVKLIVPPGGEPHTFDPSPSLVRSLQSAEAVYTIGHGLDEWVRPILSNLSAKEIVLDNGIALRSSQNVFADVGAEKEDDPVDPHYWLTISNARKMVLTINADLQTRFPDHADEFQKNTDAYLQELSEAEKEIRTILSPAKNRALITLHDAWYYFAEEYGLRIAGTYLPTAGREPSAQYLAALANAVQTSGARTLFHEPQFSTASLQSFADDYGLRLVVLDDIGGIAPRDSYLSLMIENAKAIADNP